MLLLRGAFLFVLLIIGLSLVNYSIYGLRYRNYSNYLNALIGTLFNQAAYGEQDEHRYNMSEFIFALINNALHYWLNILMLGITLAPILGEYKNEAYISDIDTTGVKQSSRFDRNKK